MAAVLCLKPSCDSTMWVRAKWLLTCFLHNISAYKLLFTFASHKRDWDSMKTSHPSSSHPSISVKPPSTMNKILIMPAAILQCMANLSSFYFQHEQPHQTILRKHLYSIRHGEGFQVKPTDTSVIRERVWLDDKWFVIEHGIYMPSRSSSSSSKLGEQELCAISIFKFMLKHASESLKNKKMPLLKAFEMVGRGVMELKALEARTDNGNVVLWFKENLEYKSFEVWTDRAAAIGNDLGPSPDHGQD
ncbi:hypothetical protein BX616_010961 [Lobosporangium transversale]|nr:hypothetical protein BX616_010961 [Lobosporangium transversale]